MLDLVHKHRLKETFCKFKNAPVTVTITSLTANGLVIAKQIDICNECLIETFFSTKDKASSVQGCRYFPQIFKPMFYFINK